VEQRLAGQRLGGVEVSGLERRDAAGAPFKRKISQKAPSNKRDWRALFHRPAGPAVRPCPTGGSRTRQYSRLSERTRAGRGRDAVRRNVKVAFKDHDGFVTFEYLVVRGGGWVKPRGFRVRAP
jgi:hypothetical protein